jgi:hypothetical protein
MQLLAKRLRLDDDEVRWLWDHLVEFDRVLVQEAVGGGDLSGTHSSRLPPDS